MQQTLKDTTFVSILVKALFLLRYLNVCEASLPAGFLLVARRMHVLLQVSMSTRLATTR